MLQNNNANIHRVEGRLKQLKAAKERGSRKEENRYFRVVENTEIMRLQIFFDEKPVQDIRSIFEKEWLQMEFQEWMLAETTYR